MKDEDKTVHSDANQVEIMDLKKFEEKEPEICAISHIYHVISNPAFCTAANYQGIIYGTFVIPSKNNFQVSNNIFAFCLTADKLYFIDEGSQIRKKVKDMEEEYNNEIKTPIVFLLDFMEYLIREDLYFLQGYEDTLRALADRLEKGSVNESGEEFMHMRNELDALLSYYEQLANMAQTLDEVVVQSGDEVASNLLSIYVQRVNHLAKLAHSRKDSLIQILDMKQAKLSERQNDLMNLLTIVTSIFTPLTLVTGWFGMNFTNMFPIKQPWGYGAVFVFCVILTIGELLMIRKWKIFHK